MTLKKPPIIIQDLDSAIPRELTCRETLVKVVTTLRELGTDTETIVSALLRHGAKGRLCSAADCPGAKRLQQAGLADVQIYAARSDDKVALHVIVGTELDVLLTGRSAAALVRFLTWFDRRIYPELIAEEGG